MEKYYTPAIEDIHIGYECEVKEYYSNPFQHYVFSKSDFTQGDTDTLETDFHNYTKNDMLRIRTPYLTKEQIEEEGWEIIPSKLNCSVLKKEDYYVYLFEDYTIKLGKGTPPTWLNYYYKGKCPSINEFRTICKLLNIK